MPNFLMRQGVRPGRRIQGVRPAVPIQATEWSHVPEREQSPKSKAQNRSAAGSLVIGLVCFSIASGSALGAQNLLAQRDLVTHVFAGSNSKSATRPKIDRKDPWATLPRLNLLLLGADDGVGRQGV